MSTFDDGKALQDGTTLQKIAELRALNFTNTLTALAGGARAGATQLVNGLNEVTVVASDNDSTILPVAIAGTVVIVRNADAGQDIQIFGKGSDTLDGTAGSTGLTLGEGKSELFFCPVDTKWYTLVGNAA